MKHICVVQFSSRHVCVLLTSLGSSLFSAGTKAGCCDLQLGSATEEAEIPLASATEACGSGLRVEGLGLRVQGLGFRA